MAAPGSPARNDMFLGLFGTPALLLEGVALSGVHGAALLLLFTRVCGEAAMVRGAGDHSRSHIGTIVAGMEG